MPRKKKIAEITADVKETAAVAEAPVEAAVEAAPVEEAPKKRGRKTASTPAEKKPVEKKPATKKATTRKPAVKAETKVNLFVQFMDSEISYAELVEKAKTEAGVKSPKSVNLYVKPEENMVYYVVDEKDGGFVLA